MQHQRVGPKEKIERGQIKLTEALFGQYASSSGREGFLIRGSVNGSKWIGRIWMTLLIERKEVKGLADAVDRLYATQPLCNRVALNRAILI
jgi:hypothetical protein